jgi:hypothetical protein
MASDEVRALLAEHKQAVLDYREWDMKVKDLLVGRKADQLSRGELATYREIAARRDEAYDRMRHLEQILLAEEV